MSPLRAAAHQLACLPGVFGLALAAAGVAGMLWVRDFLARHHREVVTGLHDAAAIVLCITGLAVLAAVVRSAHREAAARVPAPRPVSVPVPVPVPEPVMIDDRDEIMLAPWPAMEGDMDMIELGPGR